MSDNPPKVIIKEIPTPIYPVSYQGIDIKYENILKKRSLKNIKGLNPIYNPGIFQSDNKTIKGIKAFIIKGNNKKDILANYKEAFINNDFNVFPFFEYNYNFSVDKAPFILSINKDEQIFVNSTCLMKVEESDSFAYNNELYSINEFISYDDDKLIQIYLVKECIMVIFDSKVEIDGFFICQEDFSLSDYKVKEIKFLNKEIDQIKSGQFLLYEVKKGGNLPILLEQMMKNYYFLKKFFYVLTKYNFENFVYLGFYRNRENIKIEEEIKNKFEKLQMPSLILRYEDSLFGESLKLDEEKSIEIEEIKLSLKESGNELDNIGKKLDGMADRIGNKFDGLLSDLQELKNLIKTMPSNNHNVPNNSYEIPYNIYNTYTGNYSVPFPYASPIIIYYPYSYPINIQPLNNSNSNINNSQSDSEKEN